MVTVCPRAWSLAMSRRVSFAGSTRRLRVGAEVCVGFAGGKHVPDDDAAFVGDGDDGFVLRGRVARAAELADMPAVQTLQIVVSARRGPRAFDEYVLQMLVSLSGFAGMAFARGFVVARTHPDPGREVAR